MIHPNGPESDFTSSSKPVGDDSSPAKSKKRFDVIVPVFMRVSLSADDSLEAEVLAQEHIKQMGVYADPANPGGVKIAVVSIISPIVQP
jgi:hypothetical protein